MVINNMDKIYLKDITIFAHHGVLKEEKALGQKFIIDLELDIDIREAGKTDDLSKTVNYAKLCYEVEEVFTKESYDLIEKVAEKVCEFILNKYSLVNKVKLTLKKPWAPILRNLEYPAIEIERSRHIAYLSIGSNISDKEKHLKDAIEKIDSIEGIKVTKVSSFIKTEPWGYLEQEEFLNAALKIETLLTPKELMTVLLGIESDMKRERVVKWGPRIIDLDIIFYDDVVSDDEFVTLPHPLMEDREFVLKPLNEIAPNYIHPLLKKRVFRLLRELKSSADK